MENKYKKLINNSFSFAVGNLGSKLIVFLMLPLYTYKLTTVDFGVSDLIQTTVSLLVPIVSLSIFDAVLRFSMDNDEESIVVLNNGFTITLISSILIVLVSGILEIINVEYSIYTGLLLILSCYQSLFSYYAKAIGKIKVFSISGIIMTFITAFCNIIFLVIFNLGIDGYIYSIILGYVITNLYLVKECQLFESLSIRFDKELIVKLLAYSLPLIPNAVSWFASNSLNRYFILFILGSSSNGIYAVANKIPALLTLINSIFFQAWQISVIEESKSDNRERYYTDVFSSYSKILFIGFSGILLILKPTLSILIAPDFFTSWKLVPVLLFSVLYSSFSSFFGQYYTAQKNTKGVFYTTVIGAIISIIGGFILIHFIGLQGAGLGIALSFFVMWVIRIKDTKSFAKTSIDWKNLTINHCILLVQSLLLFKFTGLKLFVLEFLLFFICIYYNRSVLLALLSRKKED